MVRPQSIVRYERLYLLSFVLGLAVSALTWSSRVAMLAKQPALAGQTWPMWLAMILGILLSLALWYFTARRPSVAAKWIVVLFAGMAVIGLLMALMQTVNRGALGLPTVLGIADDILYIAAAALLFRRDAVRWFGDDVPVAERLA